MMQNYHSYGSPITVLNFTEDLEDPKVKDQLEAMFKHPDVKNRQIVAFSVIGSYRKGKSLFLNYCLRYFYAHFQSINFMNNPMSNPKGWMGIDDEPLVGFSWRSGADPDTKGIVIWNDIFLYTNENGEQIGIVVIDTQGLFNSDSSQADNSKIFALGTLISSIQVFNLSGVVQEDQLQYLQFAAEYAKFALSKDYADEKPFQKLFFLIRDWDNPQEYPFGCVGGEKYLQRFFNSKANKTDELKSVYEYINSLYQDLSCSLLPNPGKIVSQGISKLQNKKYDGSLSGMDEDFKEELVKVIEHIVSPENLIPKRFEGKCLNGAEFLDHMQHYFKFFLTNKIPEVQTVLESIVKNEMKPLISLCVDKYKNAFRKVQNNLSNLDQMQQHHEECRDNILILFKDSIKIGNSEDEAKYKLQLVDQIDDIYREHIKQLEINEKKIEEENNKIRVELEMKHKQELEEMKRELEAQRKKNEMELQKMKENFEQKKISIQNEITNIRKQTEKEDKETESMSTKQMRINEQCNSEDESMKSVDYSYKANDFDSNNHLYDRHMYNTQECHLQYRNSPEISLRKPLLYSQSTYVDNNNDFLNIPQHRSNQTQKDFVRLNSHETISNNPFIQNEELTRVTSSTGAKSSYLSPVQPNQIAQRTYSSYEPSTSPQYAQMYQNNQIQRNGPTRQYNSRAEACGGSSNFSDQFNDKLRPNLHPQYTKSINHFNDATYNQQSPFKQFSQNDQQNYGRYHNYNQNIMPPLTQCPFEAPENRNIQLQSEQYNKEFEITHHQGNWNNYGGPCGMHQNVDYGNPYEQRSIKMQTSSFDPRNQASQIYNQIYSENYNQSYKDRSTPNNCGGRSSEIYNPVDHNSFYERERFGNANNYTFIKQSQANEQQLQEGQTRLAMLKAEIFAKSQREKEDFEEKLRQRSRKKQISFFSWRRSKSPEKLKIRDTTTSCDENY